MSRYIQRYRVFDVEANAIMTDEMLARRLIYRLEYWREYFDKSIKRELNLLTVVIRDDLYFSERAQWSSCSAIRRVIRAEFRITYIVHGRSTAYNYETVRHMMTNDTEGKSVVDEIVQLRPLYDDSDDFLYPLYSADIPVRMIRAIRTVWCVINALPDDDTDDEESDDEDTRALRFVIAAYGTWAYTNAFLTNEAALCSDVLDLARRCYQRYERVFTLAHFLQEYRRYAKPDVQFVIRGTVQADYVARALILDPRHTYNRIVRTSVQVCNATTFFKKATALIKRSVHVVPSVLVYPKRKDITWLTVKVGDFVTLSSGVQLEPCYIRQRLREIDRNRRSRAARDDDRSPRPPRRRRRREPIRPPQPDSDSGAIVTPSRRPITRSSGYNSAAVAGPSFAVSPPPPPPTASPPPPLPSDCGVEGGFATPETPAPSRKRRGRRLFDAIASSTIDGQDSSTSSCVPSDATHVSVVEDPRELRRNLRVRERNAIMLNEEPISISSESPIRRRPVRRRHKRRL